MAEEQVVIKIQIDLDGNERIKELEKALKDAGDAAKKALKDAEELAKKIPKDSSAAADSLKKLGAIGTGAYKDIIGKGAEFLGLSGKLKSSVENFGESAVEGLGDVAKGFKKSTIGVKLFGSAGKAALASIGIGLLITAVGFLIANWDKLVETAKKFSNVLLILAPPIGLFIKALEFIEKKFGSIGNLIEGVKAGIVGFFTVGKNASDEFNKSIEKGIRLKAFEEQVKGYELVTETIKNQIKVLQAQGKKEEEIFKLRKQEQQIQIDRLIELKSINGELTEDEAKSLRDKVNNLKVIQLEESKFLNEKREKTLELGRKLQEDLIIIEQDVQAKRLKEFDETNKKILESFKDFKIEMVKFDVELEKEKFDELEGVTKERTAAILDIQSKIGIKKAEAFNQRVIEEEIKFLESKRELTLEEEEILNELKAEIRQKDLESISNYIEVAGSATNQIFQAFIDANQRLLESLKAEFTLLDSRYDESVNKRIDLESQLATAEGARYSQILASIEEERLKENNLAKQKERIAKAQIDQQNKVNELTYANAIIQSTILTAQAVLAALATVPPASFVFAAITAGLAAVQTAIVVSNKPKKIGFDSGGYTGDGGRLEPAGIVHKGEYVIPQSLMKTEKGYSMAAQLEAMRTGSKRGFESGGFVTPNLGSDNNSTESLMQALSGMNLQVAVTEINSVQSRVKVIETRGSL